MPTRSALAFTLRRVAHVRRGSIPAIPQHREVNVGEQSLYASTRVKPERSTSSCS